MPKVNRGASSDRSGGVFFIGDDDRELSLIPVLFLRITTSSASWCPEAASAASHDRKQAHGSFFSGLVEAFRPLKRTSRPRPPSPPGPTARVAWRAPGRTRRAIAAQPRVASPCGGTWPHRGGRWRPWLRV